MQLADQKQSDRDELEPILYAALINSMVQNFWAIFLGSASAAGAAVMTALKTGDGWLWAMAYAVVLGIALSFLALLAWGLHRVSAAPSQPVPRRTPPRAPRKQRDASRTTA